MSAALPPRSLEPTVLRKFQEGGVEAAAKEAQKVVDSIKAKYGAGAFLKGLGATEAQWKKLDTKQQIAVVAACQQDGQITRGAFIAAGPNRDLTLENMSANLPQPVRSMTPEQLAKTLARVVIEASGGAKRYINAGQNMPGGPPAKSSGPKQI